MKKLIIKTIVITLSSIISLVSAVFGALCVFTPTTIASVFEDMGFYKQSVFFYELKYEQSNKIEDLVVLVDKAYGNNDATELEEYLGKLIWHEDFFNYCRSKDEYLTNFDMPTQDYFVGYYATVLINNGKFDSALDMSKSYVDKFTYTEFNPIRTIIKESFELLTAEQKIQLKEIILAYEQNDFINEDLIKFN